MTGQDMDLTEPIEYEPDTVESPNWQTPLAALLWIAALILLACTPAIIAAVWMWLV